MIDSIDKNILIILQKNGRESNANIARSVGLTAPAVHERIRKMRKNGIIKGFSTEIDPAALGLVLLAIISVRLSLHKKADAVGAKIGKLPGVQEVIHMTGEDCFQVKARIRDTAELEQLLLSINDLDQVATTNTRIALRVMKESNELPIALEG